MAQALIRIFLLHSSLAGLVVFAERLNPIPSRTRPLNFPAPMVLSLKAWKSRSLPGLPRTRSPQHDDDLRNGRQQWRPFCFQELPSEKTASGHRSICSGILRNQDARKDIKRTSAELVSQTLRPFPDQTFPSHSHRPVAEAVRVQGGFFSRVSWQVHEIGAFALFPLPSVVAT